jgi:hypothetical protein
MKKLLPFLLCGVISTQAYANDSLTALAKTATVAQGTPVATADATQSAMALIPMLTQGLGVTEAQATGGMGSILQAAKGLMSGTDFGTLSSAIPNANSLLSAAPKVAPAKKGDLLGGAMDMAGQLGKNTQIGQQLLSQFKSLGLSPDMISKFADVAVGYLQKGEVPQAADLLNTALSSVLPQ